MEFRNSILTLYLMFASLPIREGKRIIGGRNCKKNEFPSLVSLTMDFGPLCGGTILNELHVITAAHCFSSNPPADSISVTAGDIRIDEQASNTRQRVKLRKIVIHPKYDDREIRNDIAIVIVSDPLKINNKAVSAAHINSKSLKIGTKVLVAGWGRTSRSQWKRVCKVTQITVFKKEKCESDNTQICAGDITGASGPYDGDSGGPLYVVQQHKLKIVGIASYVHDDDARVGVYADIAYHRNWIMKQITKAVRVDDEIDEKKSLVRRSAANQWKKPNKIELFMLLILPLRIVAAAL